MLSDSKVCGALETVDGFRAQAESGALIARERTEEVLSAQTVVRDNSRLLAAMRSSRLPAVKTLDQFAFSFQPSLKREQIESLQGLGFLKRVENVIPLVPPSVGKTHLAIAAAESGRKVYYGTLAPLIESLTEAKAAGHLSRRLRVLTHPALLCRGRRRQCRRRRRTRTAMRRRLRSRSVWRRRPLTAGLSCRLRECRRVAQSTCSRPRRRLA